MKIIDAWDDCHKEELVQAVNSLKTSLQEARVWTKTGKNRYGSKPYYDIYYDPKTNLTYCVTYYDTREKYNTSAIMLDIHADYVTQIKEIMGKPHTSKPDDQMVYDNMLEISTLFYTFDELGRSHTYQICGIDLSTKEGFDSVVIYDETTEEYVYVNPSWFKNRFIGRIS